MLVLTSDVVLET